MRNDLMMQLTVQETKLLGKCLDNSNINRAFCYLTEIHVSLSLHQIFVFLILTH